MFHNFKSSCISLVLVVLIAVTLLPANLQSQSRVTTKSGNTFIGFVQSSNDAEIELISLNNEKVVIPKSSVIKQELLILSVSTKSGLELSGSISRISEEDFDLRTSDGIQMTIRFDGVEEFRSDDKDYKKIIDRKIVSNAKKSEDISDLKMKNSYQSYRANKPGFSSGNKPDYQKFGVNFGTPAGFNLLYGYTTSSIGFHLSAGYWGHDMVGLQIGPSLNLGKNEDSELNLVLAYGILQVSDYSFESLNILVDANIYGFHFEVGFGMGDGNVSSPQLLFQLGYAYRWE